MERDENPNALAASEAQQLDILKQEYNNASVEYNEVLSEYRKQISLLNYYVTIFTGVLLFLFTSTRENNPIEGRQINSEYILAFALIFSISLLYYIYSNAIDIVYNLYLVEAKRASLEKKINVLLSQPDLLNWDSQVVRHFNEDLVFKRGWLNPSILTAAGGGVTVIVITVIHCVLSFILLPNFDLKFYFTIVVCVITSFLLHQFAILHTTGKKYIFDYVYKQNAVQARFKRARFDVSYVPILTFLVGPLAFIIFSIKENAFWYTGAADFPYVFIWTMSVGDTLLLPIINYKFSNLFFNLIGSPARQRHNRFIRGWVAVTALIAVALSSISHHAWANDRFTDFIAMTPGILTIGGWWHWAFSVLQIFIFGLFFVMWGVAIRERDGEAIAYSRKLWWWVFAFSCLMLANFAHQYLTVYDRPFFESLALAKFTFVPPLVVILLRMILTRSERTVNFELAEN